MTRDFYQTLSNDPRYVLEVLVLHLIDQGIPRIPLDNVGSVSYKESHEIVGLGFEVVIKDGYISVRCAVLGIDITGIGSLEHLSKLQWMGTISNLDRGRYKEVGTWWKSVQRQSIAHRLAHY